MKFGINVPNFGTGTDPASLAEWVQFARQRGLRPGDDVRPRGRHAGRRRAVPAPVLRPVHDLGVAGGISERIELGTTVTVLPFRNPLLTARMAANIDRISGGRFTLGVGVGWSEQEYAALGVPFDRRGAIADEYLAAVRERWTTEVASYNGEFVSFRDVYTAPSPSRQPHPPIWVGGTSTPALRRAVAFADAWHPNNAELSWLRTEGLPTLRSTAAATGRPIPALSPRMRLRLSETALDQDDRRVGEGNLAQVLSDLDELAVLGAEYIVLDTNPDHPGQRRPTAVDWRMLEAVMRHADRYAS